MYCLFLTVSFFWESLGTNVRHIQPTEKQNLSFSDDLPVEIRLQVYEYLFDIPNNFFELWAPREWARNGHWAKNSFRELKSLRTRLRVMRLCKKIREEASDYFYGGNNFRFTNFNGFLVMTVFNHTIRPANCSFLKHITVQIPNLMRENLYDEGVVSKTGWKKFDQLLARRGMRVPNYGVCIKHGKRKFRIQGEGADTYNRAVLKGFRQLRNMPSLKLLEITIPWNYRLRDGGYRAPGPDETTQCYCPAEDVGAMCPEERIRHTIEDHLQGPHYWTLLADLKENAASKDLSISLVIHYGFDRLELELAPELLGQPARMRQARWIAAYAALMGYGFGYTWWETEGPVEGPRRGTYRVCYQEDHLLELVWDLEDQEENPLLEPPKLPELPA